MKKVENTQMVKKVKKGFTLVELLFVMAIISILAGIGISQMSGSTDTAENTAAKGNIRNVITEAQLFYANNTTYTGFTTTNTEVTVTVGDGGTSFCVQATGAGSTTYKYNSESDTAITEGSCSGGGSVEPKL